MAGRHCAAIVHVVFYCWSASAQCLRSSGGGDGSAYCWSAVSLSAFSVNVSWVVLLLVDGVTLRLSRVSSSASDSASDRSQCWTRGRGLATTTGYNVSTWQRVVSGARAVASACKQRELS